MMETVFPNPENPFCQGIFHEYDVNQERKTILVSFENYIPVPESARFQIGIPGKSQ